MKSEKIKNIVIVCLVVLVLFLSALVIYFAFFKKEMKVLEGTVVSVGDGYVLLEGEEDYIFQTKESFEIGDVLEITTEDISEDEVPSVIHDGSVSLKEKKNGSSFFQGNFDIIEDSSNSNQSTDDNKKEPNTREEEKNPEESILESNADYDATVLSYVNEVENSAQNENVLKSSFITLTDFLFYQGTIKGVTLNQITSKTKLAVMKCALLVDQKIDQLLPGYKEKISSTTKKVYTGMKEKVITLYINTTTKICTSNSTLCDDAKRDFQSMKSSFGITWDILKTLIQTGVGNLKDWYEIYSGK